MNIYQGNLVSLLSRCADDYVFLYTADPRVALQGGFYWMRPNMDIFQDMMKVLKTPGMLLTFSDWDHTGPFFSMFYADEKKRMKGSQTQSFAAETPQGFLFYYFATERYLIPLKGHQADENSVSLVGQLEICEYNYRSTYRYYFAKGLLDLVCASSIKKAVTENNPLIDIKACHGCMKKAVPLTQFRWKYG